MATCLAEVLAAWRLGVTLRREMHPDELITQARAQIIWGDPPQQVLGFLRSNGLSKEQAEEQIRRLLQERNREVRKAGLRSLVIGCAVAGPAACIVYLGLSPSHHYIMGTTQSKGLGVGLGLAAYGLYKIVNGIIDLTRPQSEHRAISDVTL